MRSRKIKDILLNSLTYLFSSFGVLILVLIFRSDERSLHDIICKTKVIEVKNT